MSKTCIVCGKKFEPLSSRQKTCSLQCTYDVARNEFRCKRAKKNSSTDEKTCPICGEKFTPSTKHPFQKYCSVRCRKRAPIERAKLKTHFAVAWEEWKRDFIARKTQSNSGSA